MDYEKKYKDLIQSFKEYLIEIYRDVEDVQYIQKLTNDEVVEEVFSLMDYAVRQPNQQIMAIQLDVLRKAFSR